MELQAMLFRGLSLLFFQTSFSFEWGIQILTQTIYIYTHIHVVTLKTKGSNCICKCMVVKPFCLSTEMCHIVVILTTQNGKALCSSTPTPFTKQAPTPSTPPPLPPCVCVKTYTLSNLPIIKDIWHWTLNLLTTWPGWVVVTAAYWGTGMPVLWHQPNKCLYILFYSDIKFIPVQCMCNKFVNIYFFGSPTVIVWILYTSS